MKPHSVYAANDTLGEGPVWAEDEQALYWVDIEGRKLQRWHPETGDYTTWSMPSKIGCYALREQGGAVVALEDGFSFFDFKSGELEAVYNPEPDARDNRFNDGKCDRQGRFWAGTMGSGDTPTGAFYRLDRDASCDKVRDRVGISNGLGWSPDNSVMYYTDTSLGTIFAFDFDTGTGELSNERVFAEVNEGFPDGLTVDSEGYVWSAVWEGWRVNRFAPNGKLEQSVELPVARVTSCTFGGKDLNELSITTARVGASSKELKKQSEAGNIFRLETAVKGILEPKFAGCA